MATATRLIKKYPNRRLYDTQTSAYITLVDIKQLVLENEEFRVVDAKSNDDLTRGILLQIILEEEAGGTPLFSSSMLVQIIRFYGHATQGMMGTYLEKTMQAFVEIQHRMQEQSKTFYDGKGMPNSELWAQFMSMQAPMVQAMMGNYIEQSKNLFVQMQEQMQTQTRTMFQKFPFPGAPTVSGTPGGANGSANGAESRGSHGSGASTSAGAGEGSSGAAPAAGTAAATAGPGGRGAPGGKASHPGRDERAEPDVDDPDPRAGNRRSEAQDNVGGDADADEASAAAHAVSGPPRRIERK